MTFNLLWQQQKNHIATNTNIWHYGSTLLLAIVAFLAIKTIILFIYLTSSVTINHGLNAKIADITPKFSQQAFLEKSIAKMRQTLNSLQKLNMKRWQMVKILAFLGETTPPQLFLKSIIINEEKIVVTGETSELNKINLFLKNLSNKNTENLSDVVLLETKKVAEQKNPFVFSIAAKITL